MYANRHVYLPYQQCLAFFTHRRNAPLTADNRRVRLPLRGCRKFFHLVRVHLVLFAHALAARMSDPYVAL